MKVADLISALEKCPPDDEVEVADQENCEVIGVLDASMPETDDEGVTTIYIEVTE